MLLAKLIINSTSSDINVFKCHLCPEYSIWVRDTDNSVRAERIIVKNFMLAYEPDSGYYPDGIERKDTFLSGRIGIILCGRKYNELLHQFYGKKLTHELAVQWVNRFNNLTVFQ